MHTTGTPMITIVLDSKTMVPDAGRRAVMGGYSPGRVLRTSGVKNLSLASAAATNVMNAN